MLKRKKWLLYRNKLNEREYVKEERRFWPKLADTEAAKLKKFSDAGRAKIGDLPTLTETDPSTCFGISIERAEGRA